MQLWLRSQGNPGVMTIFHPGKPGWTGDPIRWNCGMIEWNGRTAELRNTQNILKYGVYGIF